MTEQKVAGKTTFVLKDPATSRFFRLKEAEYFIAQQLDGSTRPEAICQRAEEKLGARLSSQTLEEFIATLRGHGLLAEAERQRLNGRGAGRIRGNLLYLRLKAFDPDRLLERLLSWCRFCFTPCFVTCGAIFVFFYFRCSLAFPERGKRMWVTFAGSFFDLLVWAAATLIWRLTEPEVWVHSAALVRIGTLGIEIGQQVLLKARAHPQKPIEEKWSRSLLWLPKAGREKGGPF